MRTGSAWLRCFTETPREPVLPRGLGRQDKGRASLVSRGRPNRVGPVAVRDRRVRLGSGRQPAALLAPAPHLRSLCPLQSIQSPGMSSLMFQMCWH